jgi:hypothetical protein
MCFGTFYHSLLSPLPTFFWEEEYSSLNNNNSNNNIPLLGICALVQIYVYPIGILEILIFNRGQRFGKNNFQFK